MRYRYRPRSHLLGIGILLFGLYVVHHPWLAQAIKNSLSDGQLPSLGFSNVATSSPALGQVSSLSGLPNPALTPGALNSMVTPDDLYNTICRRGWTRTVRPDEDYTERLKRDQIRQYGYADRRLGAYEEDHLVSLELGGSPTSPKNLWPEPHQAAGGWGSYAKDRLENRLNHLVCNHEISLADAQTMIATNWIAAYQRYVGSTPDNRPSY
ncbi:hypothetical protein [Acidocella sp.]|uniref:hypothetical protein n=1 Tax=Acidocella sp. TaxID=50710 RepID=UPI003D06AD2E